MDYKIYLNRCLKFNKYKMRNLSFIIISLAFLIGCDKKNDNNEDYRDKYVGEYKFTTFSIMKEWDFQLDTIHVTYDTIKFSGSIIKYENEKLTITFQSHETEPELDSTHLKPLTLGKIYPTVDLNGTLSYPEFVKYGGGIFSGMFIGNDTIDFSYGYQIHAFTINNNIIGIKTTQYE
ncbi:MAG TPA: hypothetical protein PLI65_11550 [Bacteroidales bacterium]|nr:hypothetical protein [Bacteroidales bacterium]